MRAEPVSSATCRQIALGRSLRAGDNSLGHCPALGRGHLSSPELRGDAPLNPVHITLTSPRPFIITLFIQTLSNPTPTKIPDCPMSTPRDGLGAAGNPPRSVPGLLSFNSAAHSTALLLIRSGWGGLAVLQEV